MNGTIEGIRKSIEEIISETDEVQLLLYTVEEDIQMFRKGNAKLKADNEKLRELVAHLMYVKPADVTAIAHDGKLLRFDEMLAEVGMRFEADE